MSEARLAHKRKSYFIKRDFQFKFIFKFCLLLLIGVFISTGLLLLFSQDSLTSTFKQSKLTIKNTGVAILPAVIYTNLITLALITVAAVAVTLFVSHRIAGPMYRFQKELRAVAEGDLTKRITLRKKDQIGDIADSLNGMIASLREKIVDIQTGLKDIQDHVSRENAPEELVEKIQYLSQKIAGNFKI